MRHAHTTYGMQDEDRSAACNTHGLRCSTSFVRRSRCKSKRGGARHWAASRYHPFSGHSHLLGAHAIRQLRHLGCSMLHAACCMLHVAGGAGAGQSPADGKHPEADSHLSLRPAGRASARLAQALPSISSPRRIVRKLDANVFIASPGRMRTSARWLGSGRQCTGAARWPVS